MPFQVTVYAPPTLKTMSSAEVGAWDGVQLPGVAAVPLAATFQLSVVASAAMGSRRRNANKGRRVMTNPCNAPGRGEKTAGTWATIIAPRTGRAQERAGEGAISETARRFETRLENHGARDCAPGQRAGIFGDGPAPELEAFTRSIADHLDRETGRA